MADWRMKRLDLKLKSPLRCGHRPLGFVARTLPFVPGHVPLLSLVPVVVGHFFSPKNNQAYLDAQGFLEKHVRFSPFFILHPDTGAPLWPWEKETGLSRIEADCLNARHGVALDYAVRGTREGYLFEIESIGPHYRSTGEPVKVGGYLFFKPGERDNLHLDDQASLNEVALTDLIAECQWGGERNKGYGRLAEVDMAQADVLWGESVDLKESSANPVVTWHRDQPAPFYLKYVEDQKPQPTGKLTPISGRIYDQEKGPGHLASRPHVVWDLGWRSHQDLRLELFERIAIPFGQPQT